MYANRTRLAWVWLLLVAGLLIGCTSIQTARTPPGASSISGSVDGAVYSFHYWEEGLSVLIWHDASNGGVGCNGSGSSEDPLYRLECEATAADGRGFRWTVHTGDGVTADMWIDDQSFDLAQGAMFLVGTRSDTIEVEQLQRDFSTLERSAEAIAAMANNDPAVASFVARTEATGTATDSSGEAGLSGLMDALATAGQTVMLGGQVEQPFFSVPGQIVAVDGEEVQVFQYADAATADSEAALISPDAGSVGTSMMSWVATPHFYKSDRLIALYVGEDDSVASALSGVLGAAIAEGQGGGLPPAGSTGGSVAVDAGLTSTLPAALANGDYAAVQAMMGDPFVIGYWGSEGAILTPAEAIEQLQLSLLPNPAAATFTTDPEAFPDLGSFDPMQAFGPLVEITDLVYSQGWGGSGEDAAILVIARNPEGNAYWHGVIVGLGGLGTIPGPVPAVTALSFEPAVYRNEANNFELSYPATWEVSEEVFGSRGSGALFLSEGEVVLSATVYLWDPKNDLDAYADLRKQGWSSSSTVVSEEALLLADGRRATLFVIQGPDGSVVTSLLTEVGDNYLELSSDGALPEFAEIAGSLRFVEE